MKGNTTEKVECRSQAGTGLRCPETAVIGQLENPVQGQEAVVVPQDLGGQRSERKAPMASR